MFGRVRMYEMGFLVFVLGSLACALAWNEASIIGFRILQGIGGAFVTANSGAVIADLYPRERRGRAYGYNAVGWSLGAVLGIVVGGLIVTYISWRGSSGSTCRSAWPRSSLRPGSCDERGERARRHFDLLGMITLGLGLFGVLWAMTTLATSRFDASVGRLPDRRRRAHRRLRRSSSCASPSRCSTCRSFKVPTMAPSLLASLFQGLANFAVLFLVIMYLQGPRGLSRSTPRYCSSPATSSVGASGHSRDASPTGAGRCCPPPSGSPIQVVALAPLRAASLTQRAVAGRAGEHRQRRRGELPSSPPTAPRS